MVPAEEELAVAAVTVVSGGGGTRAERPSPSGRWRIFQDGLLRRASLRFAPVPSRTGRAPPTLDPALGGGGAPEEGKGILRVAAGI